MSGAPLRTYEPTQERKAVGRKSPSCPFRRRRPSAGSEPDMVADCRPKAANREGAAMTGKIRRREPPALPRVRPETDPTERGAT
ncbi:hypothetical protein Pden_1632 [Paracoccus denitrificans PD1222]|uniref:Uncharacterized protein n=1 Tax=Paracoccus denitrificans (strain Pd 1222) TaxID=318586 RepID=A1B2I6_PARDP|nr:hypothetical protein Pden_1632 [Paracoccus denitrificans PD1222]